MKVVCFGQVCYERGLLWVICYERVYFEWEPLLFCFYESRVSNCLLKLGSAQKPPHTEGGGGNCICCNNFDLKNKNVN